MKTPYKKRFSLQMFFCLFFTLVTISWQSVGKAGEVVLTPGYIGGTIQVGSEKITYASISASWSTYSASSTISPNATTATYNLTANVPSGSTPSYNVSCYVGLNNNQYLYFPSQSVPVTENETSTADFTVTPGFIEGTITVTNGGTLSSAYIYAYQSSTDGYTYSYRYSIPSNGTYRMAVTPNTNISVYGTANIGGANVTLVDKYVPVSAGETVTVDWTIDPPATEGSISGDININGAANAHYLVVNAYGPANKSQTLTANGSYSLSGLPKGTYSMYAYAYFNSYDDYFQVPYAAFSPTRTPSVSGGDTTVDISADQAFINGKITLSGTKSLTDASSAYIATQGVYGTNSYGGYAYDRVNLQTGAYDLVLSAGKWAYRNLSINFYNTNTDTYLYEYLTLYDYNAADNVTLAAGQTENVDISYALGSVTIIFRIDGTGTLSTPRLSGYCYVYGSNNNLTDLYYFNAYNYSQLNVQEGSVSFVAPEGTYSINAYAKVGGAEVTFGSLSVEVVAGADVIIDIGGPTLTVESPSPDYITSNSSIDVTGKATDDLEVASVSVNGNATTLTSTNNSADPVEVAFSATVSLNKGPNQIETIAYDTSNKLANDKRTVYRDEGPPVLDWSPANGATSSAQAVTVEGTATDDAGIDSITVNNTSVSFQTTNNPDDLNEVSFSTSVTLNTEGDTYITVIATDISTQETSETHLVTYGTNQPPVADAGTYSAVEQSELDGAEVTLDGSGSDDPDNDELTYSWTGPFGTATGVNPEVTLPLGVSNITLVVNDGTVDSVSSTAVIRVEDTTAPNITAPADISAEQANASGTEVSLGSSTVSDICDASPEVTNDAPAVFPLGDTTVTWTATDATGNVATATQVVTIVDTTAPVITMNGAASMTVECHDGVYSEQGATASDICDTGVEVTIGGDVVDVNTTGTYKVTYDAVDASGNNAARVTRTIEVKDTTPPTLTAPSAVSAEQTSASGTPVALGVASASDTCDESPAITNNAPAVFPLGVTTVTWTATDASGNSATASQAVTVVDTTAPSLSVVPSTTTIWPPNHKYVTVSVGITISDVCDADVANKVKLTSVTSDEADEVSGAANKKGGGDGNAPVDIVIVNQNTVRLRAERLGGGDGRVYTLNYSVTDASGNMTTVSATVSVPHEEGGAAVDSGIQYTVVP